MKSRQFIGILCCVALIASCFLNWAWYPDIKKYFSGFFSENNYYGKPGYLICTFALIGIVAYLLRKNWLNRFNLILAGLGLGYAIKTFLLFTSGYDGFLPEPQWGLYLMLTASFFHLIMSGINLNKEKAKKAEK